MQNEDVYVGYFIVAALVIFVLFALGILCVAIIGPGYVGVQVSLGKVLPTPLYSGFHIVPPWVRVVYYDVRLRAYTMSATSNEGQKQGFDAITALTKDGLTVTLDCTVLYRLDPKKAPYVHANLGPQYETSLVRPTVRTAIREAAVLLTAVDIYSTKREQFAQDIQQRIAKVLEPHGIIMERFMLRNVQLPKRVAAAIERKVEALQEAERMRYVLQKAEQEAKVNIVEAQGLARAQQIINSTLTPLYVQYKAIEAYKELANSPNCTFVIVPTSPNGAGLPLIINPGTSRPAVK